LCVRSLNTRRLEYLSGDAQWNSGFADSARGIAKGLLQQNATAPLIVAPCYLAVVQESADVITCEDAMRLWYVEIILYDKRKHLPSGQNLQKSSLKRVRFLLIRQLKIHSYRPLFR